MSVTMTGEGLAGIFDAIETLMEKEVLVGIPHGESRTDADGMTNAQLYYLHEHGSPAKNIPARPTLVPGVASVQEKIADRLCKAVDAALDSNPDGVMKHYNAAGMIAQNAVRLYFVEGSLAPLSLVTIQNRARRGRKGAKEYLKQLDSGTPEAGLVRPLIDTGEMRKSVTYVIRKRGDDG
ncbi:MULTISPECIES: hypothetical protein [unclassified Acinetobacter]|uniref:hypothetical protein n=1 Tax=unclassified Acinetobacter TaxID=196816 RepID=UPI00244B6908|nr:MULTISPECIES: hypothetical protein [unclassified Acinetobacter]MDH0030321.1 hypothetical protein [Acinetobacter sp. GD04021]MDH0885889.1 hypothetical protein [Acinetobacter sp. GD03873]MDH1082509.1 hypothetical protein [Acinetobacter sp. GD03983]MDH2189099.1 hypothetical protein [Acinetobacter sp. GD03645]MDH2202287.1 hypothetical protein [Acinetobacter sp. GD03647]